VFKKRKTSRLFVLQEHRHLGSIFDQTNPKTVDHVSFFDDWITMDRSAYLNPTFSRLRVKIFMAILFILFVVFTLRSAHLQIFEGESYAALAENNRQRVEYLLPARGNILDRWGTVLASNEPSFTVTMTIADIPSDYEEGRVVIERVAELSGLQPTDIDLLISDFASRPFEPIPIKEHVPYELAMRLAIEIADVPGFDLQSGTKRVYDATTQSLSHVLGYIGLINVTEIEEHDDYRPIDVIGKTGVEQSFESLLRGQPGGITYEVNATGVRQSIYSKSDSVTGADISLGIDLNFQKFVEQSLKDTFASVGASRGSVVAIDPQTGAVRALVSLPAYDANTFVGGIDSESYDNLLNNEDQPLFPRSIAGEYPSGSTFKPFVAYAGLAEGIVSEYTSFLSTGGLTIGSWFFPDWRGGGHGITDARKAISDSVNTYFYIIGGGFESVTGLGVARINDYASRFGFGTPTGIDIPGEADGFLPTKAWKEEAKGERWYVGDTYHLAIGQGDFLTTPLQMAVATSVIANGGNIFEPYLVEAVDGHGAVDLSKGELSPITELDAYSLSVVRQGMRQTVTEGSARSLSLLREAVAGKTGTAQTIGDNPYHSWFAGFGPYEDPSLAIAVLIEEGGESNDAAVPLAKQIFDWWFLFGQN
jgi:penicillin-binding protein 2